MTDADVLIPPLSDPPLWEKAERVHDWRNYVGENVRRIWDTLTTEQKLAIGLDAQEQASRENWE
jgi:hypothetical protein